MKEIGGYLELERFVHKEYYSEAIALNTARNAFIYVCRARGIKKVYLPYFLCDCISKVCERENIEYSFYNLREDTMLPDFDKKVGNEECLYVVNYYGQLKKSDVIRLKNKYKNILLDNTQAFFIKPVEGIDTIYSCRKFFGVPDGAYLYSEAKRIALQDDYSGDRFGHLLGRFERSASEFYQDFKENDKSFVDLPLKNMSALTHNILGAIDYKGVKRKREINWNYLNERLKDENGLSLRFSQGPYAYPFYTKDGERLREKLIKNKIYVPVLWPNVFEIENCEREKDLAKNVLPLPCDHRYSIKDMEKICEVILC